MVNKPGLHQGTKPLEAALETDRKCFSNVILESNVNLNQTRWSDSISTVPQNVNGGDCGCIVSDQENIIVLVLLAFNVILQRSHHSLTLLMSLEVLCYCNSHAWIWHNFHQSGVITITVQLIFHNGKSSDVYRRNNNGPKTLPWCTPDTMLTCLLWQPFTITCCLSVWHKLCQYRQHRTSNNHQTDHIENVMRVNHIKGRTEINLHYPRPVPILQCTMQCMGGAENASQVPRSFR